ncbi:carbohydrate kinase family protein [Phaeacidiphilus oryzae]|uniref:carbohydrate kinase family protein n=1 Tax=Phaeacidiphilus oryzae TaxID=348818 RepID=UPI0007C660D9|nr:PfkB family carbohydrate kinase [Phaeacidiphilus oryzae]
MTSMPCHRGLPLDPLAELRTPTDPEFDVYLTGTVFLDIIFTGLDRAPVRGTETWARGMGSSPGGIANTATAFSRLGLRTALAAAFGDDKYGDYCWEALSEDEGIDLSRSRRIPGWHTPVTVSMAYEGERTMVTHGHPAPLACGVGGLGGAGGGADEVGAGQGGVAGQAEAPGEPGTPGEPGGPPSARACVATFTPGQRQDWLATAHARGSRIHADVGWDDTGRWDLAELPDLQHCEAFLPNAAEAMHYTRTESPEAAARALAELVPVAVVTMGQDGAVAADSGSGQLIRVPALQVEALDPTGAGDVFIVGFTTASLAGRPLADAVAFGCLTAALSVQEFGGALAAPGWIEIAAWWHHVKRYDDQAASSAREDTLSRYAFLDDLLPATVRPWPLRRAMPTLGFRAER